MFSTVYVAHILDQLSGTYSRPVIRIFKIQIWIRILTLILFWNRATTMIRTSFSDANILNIFFSGGSLLPGLTVEYKNLKKMRVQIDLEHPGPWYL